MIFRYIIEEGVISIKDFLLKKNIPRNVLKDIKYQNGQFLVNDQTVSGHYLLKHGDVLEVVFSSTKQGENIISIKGDFEIVYEDAYLLLINKAPNLATIPTREHYTNSLANYVMSYYKRIGIEANIHFVSRLDAPTSGLVLLAKNSYVLTLMKESEMIKKYLLETTKIVEPMSGIIATGIERDPNSIIKRRVTTTFVNSKTEYQTVAINNDKSLIEARLWTGKTHQLRLHFQSLGCPIIGDTLYGIATADNILHLHSYYLAFIHPITKEQKQFITYPKWWKK